MTSITKPFLSPGAKGHIAKRLIAYMAPHQHYCEPFAGSASVYWAKPPVDREMLIDNDPNVINTYKLIQGGDIEWLANQPWVVTPQIWERALNPPNDHYSRVWAFMYRRRASWGCNETNLKRDKVGKRLPVSLDRLKLQRQRLHNTDLHCGNSISFIANTLDRPGMYFFVDPPWPGINSSNWNWTEYDMQRLIDILAGLKHAQFMWAESPEVENGQYRIPKHWTRRLVKHAQSGNLANITKQRFYPSKKKKGFEVVFTNH